MAEMLLLYSFRHVDCAPRGGGFRIVIAGHTLTHPHALQIPSFLLYVRRLWNIAGSAAKLFGAVTCDTETHDADKHVEEDVGCV
jgi:hypothetical protein